MSCATRRISARITPGGTIRATISRKGKIEASIDKARAKVYEGAYSVTPTREAQTLYVAGTTPLQDIIVNQIPSNYGLIGWNGSVLTVS